MQLCACLLGVQISELEAENADLRAELNAFDPAFWDEVMSMKAQHGQLSRKVAQYEDMIIDLSARLGVAPPPGVGSGGGGAVPAGSSRQRGSGR